ncbi:hypothetical protein ACFYY8_01690 [Streptosporangium sp. NPDC001559]|uniref:hypothetical protein n=1 Tax=Streptosporangium sp. NPDC001559 TaxID=3366187 RepID=UPI0036E71B59
MSRLGEELRDPWGLLLGATAAGAAWAVNVPPAAAVFVGAAVWLTKVGSAVLQGRGGGRTATVTSGSQEERWLRRAEAATRSFGELGASMGDGPLAGRVALMRPQVDDAMAALRRLAQQASLACAALDRFDLDQLMRERLRLTGAREQARKEVVEDIDRALASLAAQLEVVDRLAETRDRALARMESSTISVEGLLARVVELAATSATGVLDPARVLDELAAGLEGVRMGLRETEQITRDALDRQPPPER